VPSATGPSPSTSTRSRCSCAWRCRCRRQGDRCGARLKLRALLLTSAGIERYLPWLGEPSEPPPLAPSRGPPSSQRSAHYLSSPFLQQWGDLTGARVWIKDGGSGHDTYSRGIVAHWLDEGTIEVSQDCHISGGDDGLGPASKFVLEDAASLLDQEGEWFFDPATLRLHLWPLGGGDPAGLSLEIARRKRGIATAASDVRIDGLTLRGFNYEQDHWGDGTRDAAISLRGGEDPVTTGLVVQHCVIEQDARGIDLVADSSDGQVTVDGVTLADTTLRHLDGHGINVQSWPVEAIGVSGITVERCLIEDVGFRNPEGTNSMTGASFSRVKGLRFLDNEVRTTPHNSVGINYGCEDVLIKGNHIHHCGLNSADNGCVKFWNNDDTFDRNAPRSILATENLIHDGMGWAYSSEVNETVADVQANTPYEEGSLDLTGDDAAIVVDAANRDVTPAAGSPVIDAGGELPPELAALHARLGLTLAPAIGAAYDIGAIEGTEPPGIRITSPNGGEVLPAGGQATVTWESGAFVGPVTIELTGGAEDPDAVVVLVAVTTNDGTEVVTLPDARGEDYRVRIAEGPTGSPMTAPTWASRSATPSSCSPRAGGKPGPSGRPTTSPGPRAASPRCRSSSRETGAQAGTRSPPRSQPPRRPTPMK
ncbi:MAG: right-handed parallel beta-helix repeat-containing protein, partial [Polyangiaceae bacterium]|nr:right-handed parallel beta-helix repeat-containing protein [Polyangiaceae bacterium]